MCSPSYKRNLSTLQKKQQGSVCLSFVWTWSLSFRRFISISDRLNVSRLVSVSGHKINLEWQSGEIESQGEGQKQKERIAARRLDVPPIQTDLEFAGMPIMRDVKQGCHCIGRRMLDQVQADCVECAACVSRLQ